MFHITNMKRKQGKCVSILALFINFLNKYCWIKVFIRGLLKVWNLAVLIKMIDNLFNLHFRDVFVIFVKKNSYTRIRTATKIIMLNNKATMFIHETHFNHIADHMYCFTTYTDTYTKTIYGSCSGRFRLVTAQFSMLSPSSFSPSTRFTNIVTFLLKYSVFAFLT